MIINSEDYIFDFILEEYVMTIVKLAHTTHQLNNNFLSSLLPLSVY